MASTLRPCAPPRRPSHTTRGSRSRPSGKIATRWPWGRAAVYSEVLLNPVGNAIKFTDAGEVTVMAKAENGNSNITVADMGPGIPPAVRVRIFEYFHQVDSSLTKAKGSTGLGFAIAKQIVEVHGGRIWSSRQRWSRMSKRILIFEDQEELRGVLRDLLTGSDYIVIEAADGVEIQRS